MRIQSKTLKSLIPLLKALPSKRKRALLSLIPVAILSGVADFMVVATVTRLFTVVVGESNSPALPLFLQNFIPEDPKWKAIGLVFVYIILNWVSSLSKLTLRACQVRLKTKIWRDLCEMAQRKIMSQYYEYFLATQNTNISASVLINVSRVADIVVLPLLQLISGVLIITLLSGAIFLIGKKLAAYLIFTLIISYFLITLSITPFLRYAARKRIELELQTNGILVESMKNILDVQLTHSEPYFENKFQESGRKAIPFIWKGDVLPEIPRAFIEPLGITLIFAIGIIPIASDSTSLVKIVPFLATVAVTSLKLTPPLQDTFRAITQLRAGLPDLEATLNLVDLPIERLTLDSDNVTSPDGVAPTRQIVMKDVEYKYPTSNEAVIKKINIKIPVGSRIALVGPTGSGKSTTANLLLGLLRPNSGSIQVDGINVERQDIPAWQANCAYVPQQINLLSSNIIENVAFGEEKKNINEDRVWDALKAAQLANLVSEMPEGLQSSVGENGIRLSGGQRQRLAIARAFYRNAKLLVLDEATSALDNRTEAEVMNSIDLVGRRCTLVVIAHRLSTIIRSDCIYEFENGEIKASGTFNELREKSDSFKDLSTLQRKLLNVSQT